MSLRIAPLTADRWRDFETLFGANGGCAGCWCMFLRSTSAQFEPRCAGGGTANRGLFEAVVRRGEPPGLLAYRDEVPVGWVAVAPREEYGRILRSPIHKPIHSPIDDQGDVYSITCFFIAPDARGGGVGNSLLMAAVDHARGLGARAVEAYPRDVGGARLPAEDAWRGTATQFENAGFKVVARRKPERPIVRIVF